MSFKAIPVFLLVLGGCPPDDPKPKPEPELETLSPEPEGAPEATGDGRLTCVGSNEPDAPLGNAIELTGYVRLLSDPGASAKPPAARVVAFDDNGTFLAEAWADPEKDGRVAVTVPITDEGFTGHLVVSEAGYLDLSFQSNRAVTNTDFAGWAFLFTETERDDRSDALNINLSASDGVLVGSVHDCDGFGVANAVVTLDGGDELSYVDGFDVDPGLSFTNHSGRFAAAVSSGSVEVAAWARLEDRGPLVLLARTNVTVKRGGVSAVSLDPL